MLGVFLCWYLVLISLFNSMSEAKAQAKLLKEEFLKTVGDQFNLIDPTEFPVAEQLLMYYGKLFNDEVQKNLDKSGSIASGASGVP